MLLTFFLLFLKIENDKISNDKTDTSSSKKEIQTLDDLLEFDDSVFDRAEANIKKNKRNENYTPDENSDDATEKHDHGLVRGDSIMAKVLSYGPLGASIKVVKPSQAAMLTGLVLRTEIAYWIELHGYEPALGEIIPAFVQNIRNDQKVDVSLRPIGYDKVVESRDKIMKALEETSSGVLPLGDKSLPEDIWKTFPGMSKGQFKSGIGALLREGAIIISTNEMTYVKEGERVPLQAEPWNGKSPRGWRAPDDATLFIGNLAFASTGTSLARAIEDKIGYGKIASIKVSSDLDTGRSKGFAHVDFYDADVAADALIVLNKGVEVDGRQIRVELRKRLTDREPVKAPRDWGESSLYGIAGSEKPKSASPKAAEGGDNSGWWSVFVGGLPYRMNEESLRYTIESSLSDGQGTVADMRIGREKDTGKSRGFGYVDFVDKESAERAVKELTGMMVMGRPLRLDLEGPKKRPISEIGGNRDSNDGDGGDRRRGPPREFNREGGGDERRGPPREFNRDGGGDGRRGPPREYGSDGGDRRRGPPREYGSDGGDRRRGPPREYGSDGSDRRRGPPREFGGAGGGDGRRGPPREFGGAGGGDGRRGPPREYGSDGGDRRRGPPREFDRKPTSY